MHRIQKTQSKREKTAIGLMSGTSMDGVDAALVSIESEGFAADIKLLHFITYPYPHGLKQKVIEISTAGHGRVKEICQINVLIGEVFSEAVLALLKQAKVNPSAVDFIGSHGQTVQHIPREEELLNYKIRSTLQLGEPSVIAKRTGILTVADFRPGDMAVGGQGAPLVPYFDYVIFNSPDKNRALLNIGGIANFTILKKNTRLEEIMAFDTGPGNMTIDTLVQKLFGKSCDKDGIIAQSGKVSQKILKSSLNHPYFKKAPPKSTGREEFGSAFCEKFLHEAKQFRLNRRDIISTVSELTCSSIWQNYKMFIEPKFELDEIVVSGGGGFNSYIVDSLRQKFKNVSFKRIEEFGIPSEAKEAICFALLANETIMGNCNNVPSATGAEHPTILGKICF